MPQSQQSSPKIIESNGNKSKLGNGDIEFIPSTLTPTVTPPRILPSSKPQQLVLSDAIGQLFKIFIADPSIAETFFRSRLDPVSFTRIQALLAHIRADKGQMPDSALADLLKPGHPTTAALIARYLYYRPPTNTKKSASATETRSVERDKEEKGRQGIESVRMKMKSSWWVLLSAWVLGEAVREKRRRNGQNAQQ